MDTCLTSDESTLSTYVTRYGESKGMQGRRLSQPCLGRNGIHGQDYQIIPCQEMNQRHSCPARSDITPDHNTYLFFGTGNVVDSEGAGLTPTNRAPRMCSSSSSPPLGTCLLIRALSARFSGKHRDNHRNDESCSYSEGVVKGQMGVVKNGDDTCDSSATSMTSRGSTPIPCLTPCMCGSPSRPSSPASFKHIITPVSSSYQINPTPSPASFRQSPLPYRQTPSQNSSCKSHRLSLHLTPANRTQTNGTSTVKNFSKS